MVNTGPSRGCASCRHRRKKCDGTRPSCLRCLRAKRTCTGYEAGSAFRHHTPQRLRQPLWTAPLLSPRRCSMTVRWACPVTGTTLPDILPSETPMTKSKEMAARAFLYDTCVDAAMSREYLPGFHHRVSKEFANGDIGRESELLAACLAMSYGSHGKTFNRPRMVRQAESHYQDALEMFGASFRSQWSHDPTDRARIRQVATLLGLYELIKADGQLAGQHVTHAQGLTALFGVDDLVSEILHRKTLALPNPTRLGETLSVLLLKVVETWRRWPAMQRMLPSFDGAVRAASVPAVELFCHRCLQLDEVLQTWQECVSSEAKPASIGYITAPKKPQVPAGCWGGPVDTYLDLYTAGVWNIHRIARLLLATLVVAVQERFDCTRSYEQLSLLDRLANDILASVPYHLTEDVQSFLAEQENGAERINNRGRTLGSLLLMHPLYLISRCPYLAQGKREYAQTCLEWIGMNIGIGQATLLASDVGIHAPHVEAGMAIIWAGFMSP